MDCRRFDVGCCPDGFLALTALTNIFEFRGLALQLFLSPYSLALLAALVAARRVSCRRWSHFRLDAAGDSWHQGPVNDARKRLGQFFTPPEVARTLVSWVVSRPTQSALDPACGDGEFLVCHRRSVGVDEETVRCWIRNDEPVLLLHLRGVEPLPGSVRDYLESWLGRKAKESYKCRNRKPWHVVPDVKTPDAFLSYMSGRAPTLVANAAGCVCTNSVDAVQLSPGFEFDEVQRAWEGPLCQLSCEIGGHPLGGGMLKLEPGEVANVRLSLGGCRISGKERAVLEETVTEARRWRHYA